VILEMLDEFTRPLVSEGAFDEIFVGRKPILMGVEPNSLCWIVGDLAENRDGASWARHFDGFEQLEHAVTDAGTGLLKGLALSNARRREADRPPIGHTLDVFHTKHEGARAFRVTESRVWKAQKIADDLWRPLEHKRKQGQSIRGQAQRAHAARRRAEQRLEEAVEIETAWKQVCSALEWFTPEGELNTREAAREKLNTWLGFLQGETWAKTVRMLQRPESLTFLDRIAQQLEALPLEDQDRQDAVRLEAIRRNPRLLQGEDDQSRALRAWHLVASLRMARDESFQLAVEMVRQVFQRSWRASSLVEGINSVVRMQQARHRKLTAGLIDLKRFYWNSRRFRTGRRKHCSPYELLGIKLPTDDWWQLLKSDPDQLRKQLSGQ
jgi:predicted metal-dependent hydrolase